jgi:hypothetical protein
VTLEVGCVDEGIDMVVSEEGLSRGRESVPVVDALIGQHRYIKRQS